jgi:hypothetical protein
VAGVIADYYPSVTGSGAEHHGLSTYRQSQIFAVQMQLMSKFIARKLEVAGKPPRPFGMGFGFGMAFGFGMGMPNTLTSEEADGAVGNDRKDDGGVTGVDYDKPFYLLTENELDEIEKKANEIIDRREEREARRLEQRQKREEHNRVFGPPPVPPAPLAPPRLGDRLPPRLGDVIALQARPGDEAMDKVRPGDSAMNKERLGDAAMYKERPGDLVGRAAGAVIGTANSLTFTALVDPKTGKVSQIIYREENRPGKTLNFSENLKGNDALGRRIGEYIGRIQNVANCCAQDSKANCDQKFSPESQAQLKTFRNETAEAIREVDPGGSMFNPFGGGKASAVGTTSRPATVNPSNVNGQRRPTSR